MEKKSKSDTDALLDLIKEDKKQAFEAIYNAFSEEVFSYVFTKTGNKEVSEDILQETFIGFWDRINEVNTSVIGYLKTSAKFHILKHYRSKKVEQKYIDYLQFFLNDFSRADYRLNEQDLYKRILSVLEKLPQKCKEAFLLSRFEGMTNDGIADKLNISKVTVENYISLAMKSIRVELLKLYILVLLYYFLP